MFVAICRIVDSVTILGLQLAIIFNVETFTEEHPLWILFTQFYQSKNHTFDLNIIYFW